MKRSKIIKVLLTILLFICLFACKHNQDHDIYIIYTNDVHCNIDGTIGYPGVRYLKDELSSQHTYVSLVDCGDFVEGNAYGQYRQGYEIVMLMNDCQYDVVCLGNQDFTYGMDAVKKMIDQAEFDIVDCNIRYLGSNENPLKDISSYVIKKYGSTKIGFIGVMTPDVLTTGKPSYDSLLEDGQVVYDFYQESAEAFYNQVQKTINKIRNKVDYVIVLSHLGIEEKSQPFTSYELIANTSGIDVLIDGHSHTVNHGEAVADKDGKAVVMTSTGKELENIGVLTILKDHTYNTTLYPVVSGKSEFVSNEVSEVIEEINRVYQ